MKAKFRVIKTGCKKYKFIVWLIILITYAKMLLILSHRKANADNDHVIITKSHINVEDTPVLSPYSKKLLNDDQFEHQKPRIVIIWTQVRSGTSFVSQILQHMPNTFSFIEPILAWQGEAKPNGGVNGRYFRPANESFREEIMNFFTDILHCKLQKHPGAWQMIFKLALNQQLDSLLSGFCSGPTPVKGFCEDVGNIEAFCRGAKTILHKIVSIGLRNAWKILADPDLDVRILHLVRDPRGTLASRQRYNDHEDRGVNPFASSLLDTEQHCLELEEDLRESENLKIHYPEKYLLVRYEDLITKGIGSIVNRLKLDSPLFIAAAYASHALIPQEGALSTYSVLHSTFKISSQIWQRWRQTQSYDWVQNVQSKCTGVLDRLGYRQYCSLHEYTNSSLNPLLPLV